MLRLATDDGWWLVTHPDHANLAGEFAAEWGNALFAPPSPREHVLRAIYAHDDGWRERDALTPITREGKPAAFSVELVGTYSAFEEIDLEAYLTVRRNAVQLMAAQDPYAAVLISMHTYNLLTERADRSTIRAEQLPLLDAFLEDQLDLQQRLQQQVARESPLSLDETDPLRFLENFRLLQATDNLSLLACVDFKGEASLLHPLRRHAGGATQVRVRRFAERSFQLAPYPFVKPHLTFTLRARFVPGQTFASAEQLRTLFNAASVQELAVSVSA
ncbi:MAG: DUF3891 family protein [Acidobacteriota bacterium]